MTVAAATQSPDEATGPDPKPGFWKRRLILPIRTQLTQGVSPEALSWAIAGGILTGIFPIMGTTTAVGIVTAIALRLNQPTLHAIRMLMYPLQLALILFFVRIGEWILQAEPVAFSIPQMLELFAESPARFLSEFGMTCLHAIIAWVILAPIAALIISFATRPILRRAARLWSKPGTILEE